MITQNVDRIHHSAGSNPLELHGTIYNVVCIDCSFCCYRQLFEDQLKALNPKVSLLMYNLLIQNNDYIMYFPDTICYITVFIYQSSRSEPIT
ncbi:unnamed protein product [Camellia sinensis]